MIPHVFRSNSNFIRWAVLTGWLPVLIACSKEDVNSLVEKTKQTVSDTATKTTDAVKEKVGDAAVVAKEKLQLAGKCELNCGAPLTTAACYARLITFTDGRPSVLQMQSYRDPSQETFPSVYLHAEVAASQLSELKGATVSGQVFLQPQSQGPIWSTPSDQPIQIKISEAADGMVKVVVVSGNLINSSNDSSQAVSGSLEGVVE